MKLTAVFAALSAAVLALPPVGPELWMRWNLWSLRHRPDALYLRAELHYEARALEKARAFAEAARREDPRHAGAAALLCEMDLAGRKSWVGMVSGIQVGSLPAPLVFAGCMNGIDLAYQCGLEALQRGDLIPAEQEFRRIVEYAKWLPEGVELRVRVRQAQDMLDRVAARREAGR